ncbi:MAG: hypothetical protein IIA67_06685 [Planctomycetes bacterium]|nr:hypothetical protein [Planctomycetota bacterium]
MLTAQAASIDVSTLVVRETVLSDHLDLLVKHGITAVRDTRSMRSGVLYGAEPVRYGVWRMGATHCLGDVADGRLGAGWVIRRGLARAAARSEACHLVIDAARLSRAGTGTPRKLHQVLRRIVQLRDREQVSVRTMAQTVRALAPARVESSARSILQPAS